DSVSWLFSVGAGLAVESRVARWLVASNDAVLPLTVRVPWAVGVPGAATPDDITVKLPAIDPVPPKVLPLLVAMTFPVPVADPDGLVTNSWPALTCVSPSYVLPPLVRNMAPEPLLVRARLPAPVLP